MANILVKKVEKPIQEGEVIFAEDETGDTMYIIRVGRVEIRKRAAGKQIVLAVLKEGDFFGEMSLFGDSRRSATAVALENGILICIGKKMLDQQLSRVPEWFLVMFKALTRRLRKTDALLQQQLENTNDDIDVFKTP